MKILGVVEVANRQLPYLNMSKRRGEISALKIGYVTKKQPDLFILHQSAQNITGNRYKIRNNVINIFEKFLSDGKATIRLHEPPVDLIIKGVPNQIKHFVRIIKNVPFIDPKKDPNLSNLLASTSRVVNNSMTKLVIKKKLEDVKNLQFRRTLQFLEISGASLQTIDVRIFRLQQLKVLNLVNNNLQFIPEQINLLPNLEELHLAKNKIGSSSFIWLRSSSLRSKLTLLDLRDNQMVYVPREVNFLNNLKVLLLDYNGIKRLPPVIGQLSSLKTLGLSHNEIGWLPGSFRYLKLESLDVSNNKWQEPMTSANSVVNSSSLLNLAAIEVLQNRLPYDEQTLPKNLIDYLSTSGICYCGHPCFPETPNVLLPLTRFIGRASYTRNVEEIPVIGFSCCSVVNRKKCMRILYDLIHT